MGFPIGLFWICLVLFGSAVAKPCPLQQEPKQVFVLLSYHVTQPIEDGFSSGIRETLENADTSVELHFEYMDGKHHPPSLIDGLIANLFQSKYANRCFDAILAVDNIALDFVLKHRAQYFTDIPLVFLGINNYRDSLLLGQKNITGIAEDIDLPGTLDLIHSLQPMERTLYLIHDLGETGMQLRKEAEVLFQKDTRWNPVWLDSITYENLFDTLSFTTRKGAVLPLTFARDVDGRQLSEAEFQRLLGKRSALPVYALWEHHMHPGIVGGSLLSGRQHGELAAKMVQKILAGIPADSIPIRKQSPKFSYVDHNSLERYGINPKLVPCHVKIGNPPFSVWNHYRIFILGILFAITAMLGAILVLLRLRFLLKRNRQLYRELVEHANTIILRLDSEGRVQFANEFAEKIFGYAPGELLGKSVNDTIVPPSETTGRDLHEMIRQILKHPESFMEMENENQTKQGERLWLHWYNRPVFDCDGMLSSIFCVATDITEKRSRDLELACFNKKVAHDLRTPLVTISSFAGMVLQDLKDGDQAGVEKDVEYIQHAAGKMGHQLDELLQLSRVGHSTEKTTRFRILDAVEEARKLCAGRLEPAGIEFICNIEGIITGKRQRIVEVFQNLIDNAAKHRGAQTSPRIEIGTEQRDRQTLIYVRDNGEGIPPDQLSAIFEVFVKLNKQSEGTGMGLALVKRIVETHGGRIWAESSGLGHGTTFYLMLDQYEGSLPNLRQDLV